MSNKIPRYNVYVSDMFLDTKQPKKHQERFIRKLLGDNAYYKRWRDKQQTKERTMNKKQIMYNKIQKHGDNLKAIFNLDIDSVKLCKQLFSLENKAHRLAEDYCNGITDNIESETAKIIDKVKKILNTNEVFFNGDPRGYALKLCDQFSKDKNIHKDWGGYGIIAPDFREYI